jgi:peptidoglycan hydrolase-like protein with peptidoglycan-binding domain
MKKTIITLLATAALAAPAFAATSEANQPQQQPQAQQSQDTQQQSQAQPQNGRQQKNQNQASNQQPGGAQNLSRGEVKQMQSALNKQGFKAGRPDGRLGPETRHAVQAFNQKKGIQSNRGQPTEQTLAQLGMNGNQDQNGQQPQHKGNGSEQQPSQNGQ